MLKKAEEAAVHFHGREASLGVWATRVRFCPWESNFTKSTEPEVCRLQRQRAR